MAVVIEIRMGDEDRARYGGPEWLRLDCDRLVHTTALDLERWEDECGMSIEQALADVAQMTHPRARAVRVVTWLARKQGGDLSGGVDADGRPERFAALGELRTILVQFRLSTPEVDADPPGEAFPRPESSPEPLSLDDQSANGSPRSVRRSRTSTRGSRI